MIAVRFDRANIYRDTRLFKHKSETESKARPEKKLFMRNEAHGESFK